MWKRSFVATAVALGDSVDDALAAISGAGVPQANDGRSAADAASAGAAPPDLDASAEELAAQLRSPHRGPRAAALAKAVHEIVLRIDEGTLR